MSRLWTIPSCMLLAVYYEGLQDKLAQVRDARAALNALRDEHREKLRRAAEEAERQRQIQLAQKLEIMRQKKQVIKWSSPLETCWYQYTVYYFTNKLLSLNHRSTWKCRDSWPFSVFRSRKRRGRCVWSSRSTQSRWEPKCLLSLCLTPRYTPHTLSPGPNLNQLQGWHSAIKLNPDLETIFTSPL